MARSRHSHGTNPPKPVSPAPDDAGSVPICNRAAVPKATGDERVLDLDGKQVRVTNPDKVFFAASGETKGDLVDHYVRVADPLLRAMGGRPVLLQRFPNGADGPSFFQKRVPKDPPDWLQSTVVATPNGTTSDALVAADLAHVIWAVNLGCIGFHVWPYHADDPANTDELPRSTSTTRSSTRWASARRWCPWSSGDRRSGASRGSRSRARSTASTWGRTTPPWTTATGSSSSCSPAWSRRLRCRS
jgi:hypothetical protein